MLKLNINISFINYSIIKYTIKYLALNKYIIIFFNYYFIKIIFFIKLFNGDGDMHRN